MFYRQLSSYMRLLIDQIIVYDTNINSYQCFDFCYARDTCDIYNVMLIPLYPKYARIL